MFIERSSRTQAVAAFDKAAEQMHSDRQSVYIFPEGTRSYYDYPDLLPFKKGAFHLAVQAQVPIVPVAISGGRASMRKGSAIVRPVRVSVRIGQPIPTAGMTVDDRDRLIARVRADVECLLQEGSTWN